MNDIDIGKLFSFDGRIGRKTFWQVALALWVVNVMLSITVWLLGDGGGLATMVSLVALVAYLATAVASLATTVKRLHDRGRSGWFYLIALIPFIGAIWLLIEVGFRDSVPGNNVYGASESGSPIGGDQARASYGTMSS
jgi:uncharacterized membrane protein YhaH (DUF805 family)